MIKLERLSDEKIRNAMSKAMEEAQDYGNDGKPIPERQVAQKALDDCYKDMMGQFMEYLKGKSYQPDEFGGDMVRVHWYIDEWQALQSQLEREE